MEFVQPIRRLKSLETLKKVLEASNLRDYCLFVLGINSGLVVITLAIMGLNYYSRINNAKKALAKVDTLISNNENAEAFNQLPREFSITLTISYPLNNLWLKVKLKSFKGEFNCQYFLHYFWGLLLI